MIIRRRLEAQMLVALTSVGLYRSGLVSDRFARLGRK